MLNLAKNARLDKRIDLKFVKKNTSTFKNSQDWNNIKILNQRDSETCENLCHTSCIWTSLNNMMPKFF